MRVLATILVVVAALAAEAAPAATSRGEIHGVVKQSLGGACPAGRSCSERAAHVTLVFRRHGHAVARTTTGRRGRYQLTLTAGLYVVRVASDPQMHVKPNRVRVTAARSTRVNILLGDGNNVP